MKKLLLILTLALVALAGCKKETTEPVPEQEKFVITPEKDSEWAGGKIKINANREVVRWSLEVQGDPVDGAPSQSGTLSTSIADDGTVLLGMYRHRIGGYIWEETDATIDVTAEAAGGETATCSVVSKAWKSKFFLCGSTELNYPTTVKVGDLVCLKFEDLSYEAITDEEFLDNVKVAADNGQVKLTPVKREGNHFQYKVEKTTGGKITLQLDIKASYGAYTEDVSEVDVLPATKMVSDISITMSKSEVKVGYMVRATATVSPEDATNREITWSSSNTAIARVQVVDGKNNAADVIGVSPGSVIITATAKDGSGVTASVPVTVIPDKTTFASPANCYIVTTADTYAFKAVKGNSSESVGNIASVEVLWETFGTHNTPKVGELVKNVSYSNGEITFTATHMKGNAVIAAKDALGEILWSWHIWLTDQPQELEYYNNAGIMMDRNLGATSATPGYVGSLGLLYQWGRKDPFLSSSSISSPVEAKSTITWPKPVLSDSSTGKIYYTIANPTTFIYVHYLNNKNSDWYYTGSSSTDNTRWTPSNRAKSIYDPCPAGWRVPDGGENGVWSKALGSSSDFRDDSLLDKIDQGMNLQGMLGSNQKIIWYPASGCRYYTDGDLYVGDSGSCWSASPADYRAYSMNINAYGIYPSSSSSRAFGYSVRCIKE